MIEARRRTKYRTQTGSDRQNKIRDFFKEYKNEAIISAYRETKDDKSTSNSTPKETDKNTFL